MNGLQGMTQDMNKDIVRRTAMTARTVLTGVILLLAGGNAVAQVTVNGSVYGGGNAADVLINTEVNISTGTVLGNVYGGGNVGDVGMYTVTINDKGSKDYTWQQVNGEETGKCIVNVSGGTVGSENIATTDHASGHVFGAGKGKDDTFECEKAMVRTTSVSIDNCTVWGNVYGGGQVGRVDQHTAVTIGIGEGVESGSTSTSKPIIKGNVFGAGAGLETHGYSALVRGNAEVIVQGNSKVEKSVYGGGEIAAVGRYGLDGSGMPTTLISGGECKVTVRGYSEIGSDAGGGVFGAGEGVVPHYYVGVDSYTDNNDKPKRMMNFDESIYNDQTLNAWERIEGTDFVWEYYNTREGYLNFLQTLALATDTKLIIDGHAKVHGSVYGGSRSGFVQRYTDVTIQGSCEILTIETEGIIEDGNVFGGGKGLTGNDAAGRVRGNITLYTLGGIMHGSVYGGGALSKSNTLVSEGVYPTSTVNLLGGTVMGDAYGGGLGNANTAADVGNTKVNLNGLSVSEYNANTTLYSSYVSAVDNDTPANGTDYYMVNTNSKGCIVKRVFGANNTNGTPLGDVTVHVYATQHIDKSNIHAKYAIPASQGDNETSKSYLQRLITATIVSESEGVKYITGVTESVITAAQAVCDDEDATETEISTAITNVTEQLLKRYDVEAVYGGGNEAAYIPETPNTSTTATPNGSKSQVIIDGCDYTSIETVYGGGNAAPVPESNVEIRAAYEIGYVFGGGNGKDKKSDGSENPGADIGQKSDGTEYGTGNANSTLEGGLIHEAYGGSNQKGVIKGSINQTSDPDASACELDLRKVVGAGKYADIDQDVNMILSCQPEKKVDVLFAGADEANVNGNITLTITNGNFGQVFGGNNLGGAVKGRIIVNVEETGCRPINIDELYLCGNNAAYSVYGYYQSEEEHQVTGKRILKPRESSDDEHKPVKDYNRETDTWTVYSGEEGDTFTPYDDPVLNVISCTHIGQVFGGGYGTGAFIYGNPTVNINMIQGDHYTNIPETADNPNRLGEIGTVYGGGNAADVYGNTTVNIGTEPTVDLVSTEETGKTVLGAYITGNVYGGGKGEAKMEAGTAGEAFLCAKAMVRGDEGTYVNIGNGMVRGNVYGGGEVGRVEHNTAVTIGLTSGTSTPVINGSVFGAGAGVNTHGYSALVRGNSTVIVQADAKVRGSVYGGGEKASVGKYEVKNGLPVALAPDGIHPNSGYCYVYVRGNAEIGPDNMKMDKVDDNGDPLLDDDGNPLPPDDTGYVFGGGKGVLPYEGYNDTAQPFHMNGTQHKDGEGEWDGKSWDDAPTYYDSYNDCYNNHAGELQTSYINFIKSLALATQTDVIIGGNAFVKGGVYGGSENGYVQHDTHVTIQGNCQIGNGHILLKDEDGKIIANRGLNRPYTADEWATGHLSATDADFTTEELAAELKTKVNARFANSLPECASWPYGEEITVDGKKKMIYAPYDKYAMTTTGNEEKYSNGKITAGGRRRGSDGHTFFGNVFGGGSGYFPYRPGYWFEPAGAVYGQTTIDINGGHILTNVYGGNEMTDVGEGLSGEGTAGKCIVNMEGGTLGVPRTLDEIDAHPVTCYLFGAGKGDQRVFFNKSTNVKDVEINIKGTARIYGSVFGGGEDGHVQKDVKIKISAGSTKTEGGKEIQYPYIGTWGTSYVDGNIFGAGRGFGGDAYTAGNVAGSVDVDIKGGTILGSIYGGGRLGSVGYGLYSSDAGDTYYGAMRPDNTGDDDNNTAISNFKRGYVEIEISGGTIGNDHEYIIPDATNIEEAGISETDISKWNDTNKYWTKWKNYHHVPKTDYDPSTGRLTHTKGGNVFTGGMGRQTQLDGKTLITAIDWWRLGSAKSTKLTISGDAIIKSNVYGGGELGAVIPAKGTTEGGSTEIEIQGGTIGQLIGTGDSQYTFGSVFGGGMGSEMDTSSEDNIGGRVDGSTKITMTGGTVMASVYGGGELAVVKGIHTAKNSKNDDMSVGTEINISGGTIGYNQNGFGGATMGNVYGGGKGSLSTANAGLIKNNTLIKISGSPHIYHNIYGGGAYGSVGTFTFTTDKPTGWKDDTGKTEVIITGGNIGSDGHENGMVFGSSRGDVATPTGNPAVDPNDRLAWTFDTHVVIGTQSSSTGPQISGSVYGSGENGHVYHDTDVEIHSGIIGIRTGAKITIDGKEYGGADYPYRGNVYGGGCGTDTYKVADKKYFNPLAGIVLGNAKVEMDGGHVVRTVYGGGAMGSVGTFTYDNNASNDIPDGKPVSCLEGTAATETTQATEGTGLCTVTISGGIIGPETMAMPNNYGNVFGAGRGEVHDPADYPNLETSAYFNNTLVTIKEDAFVKGSVYGGSESGHVLNDTWVKIQGGQIGCGKNVTAPYGDNDWTSSSLAPCVSWDYEEDGWAYDPNAKNLVGGDWKYADGTSTEGGAAVATDGHTFYGNVFGGGSGNIPYKDNNGVSQWVPSAGRVEGNTLVTITDGHILTNVYGGNECTDVLGSCTVNMSGGTVGVPRTKAEILQNPALGYLFGAGKGDKRVLFNTWTNVKQATVSVSGGRVYGSVYGGGEDGHVGFEGDEGQYDGDAATTISGTAHIGTDGKSGYDGNVFGGGQGSSTALTAGVVQGNVTLNIRGGQIDGSVYGGGRLASVGTHLVAVNHTNYGKLQNDDQHGNIMVNLTGGIINQDVFGGCVGSTKSVSFPNNKSNADMGISRDVTVELNKGIKGDEKGCVVKGNIFGCNNLNSSPKGHVKVYVHATQNAGASRIDDKESGRYDVLSVYGGGNMAAYEPVDLTTGKTEVIIDGCGLTSIRQVYGGGNAASTPATDVTVNGTYEIFELFGGGNGADDLPDGSPNPGANVGYKDYHLVEDQFPTKEDRVSGDAFAEYRYGTGVAAVNIMGGTVHRVFGGSNTKGNVRQTALTLLEEGSGCSFCVDEAYGGGKSAPMDAEAKIHMACIPGLKAAYGGAEAADIQGDVTLNITNGTFERVFGGNNISGTIRGSITVNIEETGCKPIIIGELYGGGNQAGYSVRGYKKVTEGTTEVWKPRMPEDDLEADMKGKTFQDPQVNIKSFTSIGEVYGGGYGEGAVMVGSPTVNINVTADGTTEAQTYTITKTVNNQPVTVYASDFDEETITIDEGKPSEHQVTRPSHVKGKVGAINNVFGGGNAAKVVGDTHVNIGTNEYEILASVITGETDVSKYYIRTGTSPNYQYNPVPRTKATAAGTYYQRNPSGTYTAVDVSAGDDVSSYYTRSGEDTAESPYVYTPVTPAQANTVYCLPVVGADIRGNVYGGGNEAEVTGGTNVTIGKEKVTTP